MVLFNKYHLFTSVNINDYGNDYSCGVCDEEDLNEPTYQDSDLDCLREV